jgi:hypothetical protein
VQSTNRETKLNSYPEFSLMDYRGSLLKNLIHYNIEVENKQKKDWALSYWKAEGKPTSYFGFINESQFSTLGAVVHMIKHRNIDLDTPELSYIDKKYAEFSNIAKSYKPEVSDDTPIEKTKEERIADELSVHIAEFEAGIDMFFSGKVFDAKAYLIKNIVKSSIANKVADHVRIFLKKLKLDAISKDEQVIEGYSHLTKRQMMKLIEYVTALMNSCEVANAIVKSSKKPKTRKEKAPSELVKSVKYLITDQISNMKSEHPSKLINMDEVWLYNAKNRRIFKIIALPGTRLTVKGSTIINIDQEKSGGKIIRNPEVQLKGIQSMTSQPINRIFKEIKGTQSRATGRMSEEFLIIKCFN